VNIFNRRVLASRDDEIERLSSFNLTTASGDVSEIKLAYETLQTEQEDLLLMLSDQVNSNARFFL